MKKIISFIVLFFCLNSIAFSSNEYIIELQKRMFTNGSISSLVVGTTTLFYNLSFTNKENMLRNTFMGYAIGFAAGFFGTLLITAITVY